MKDVFVVLADLRARARELKNLIIVFASDGDASTLRDALYELETAIHSMERAVAEVFPLTRSG